MHNHWSYMWWGPNVVKMWTQFLVKLGHKRCLQNWCNELRFSSWNRENGDLKMFAKIFYKSRVLTQFRAWFNQRPKCYSFRIQNAFKTTLVCGLWTHNLQRKRNRDPCNQHIWQPQLSWDTFPNLTPVVMRRGRGLILPWILSDNRNLQSKHNPQGCFGSAAL